MKLKINYNNHNKFITTQEFNRLASEHFPARLKQASLVSKNDICEFINSSVLDKKIKKNSNKSRIKAEQDEIEKLQTCDSSFFINDRSQNFLIFQSFHNASWLYRHFVEWQSKSLSNEKIMPPITTNSLSPKLI